MLTSCDNNKALFLGIDGGGSKCKAIVMNENNEILGTGISGPGNPLHGIGQATDSITESALLALKDAGLTHINLSEIYAGVGLAGVNLPIQFKQMQEWQSPFKGLFLAHDLLIACLGAHHSSNGAVIISGTGSCGFSCIDDQEVIIGGHGFPQGDIGSGAWFGLQAVKQVLLSLDGIAEYSIMNDVLLAKLHCADATSIVEKVAGKKATYFAQLANLVFDAAEQGDNIAIAIVTEGAEYINSIARVLLTKMPARISMLGGLTIRLKPWLDKNLQEKLAEPLSPPEVGAVLFARKELAMQQNLSVVQSA
ncbi:BadF/BadG/BcrA/BcrD ATPase family protein [Colwellia sp. 1_MG-2023]|uniref:N-acetylglucosamine kinase n=1 Tax=unclassified Colwellia TaxID=196834 RepID=UPI001C0900CB|nr:MULTISPECIES: BadF/BadG/BcrA/BcrD ATPase family protein [unclassified Colwellia]MBU2923313.1 ATPase [Colwellia sp. C2M11]MDO6653700.1 BadF/BadG/BcrA/BcrD ATPase family protein [Colwellia sp. 3_MG-2023]MDO6666511.1 BadF/BadG/BcrA/BcrD ATPase family protein [Colwellia sp. 2_MG-2023]MDO6690854.1 BadF/BadG/BcrA/BcrD ATPase family protein [Colwellia sp. 1_MG-2023]